MFICVDHPSVHRLSFARTGIWMLMAGCSLGDWPAKNDQQVNRVNHFQLDFPQYIRQGQTCQCAQKGEADVRHSPGQSSKNEPGPEGVILRHKPTTKGVNLFLRA